MLAPPRGCEGGKAGTLDGIGTLTTEEGPHQEATRTILGPAGWRAKKGCGLGQGAS
jgi:hypothetical protein